MNILQDVLMTKSLEAQLEFAQDDDWEVRNYLAENLHLHPEVQKILSQDTDDEVRKELILNRNLLPEVFSNLFLEFKSELIYLTRYNNFKYQNPKTQELLEKYLLLV